MKTKQGRTISQSTINRKRLGVIECFFSVKECSG